MIWIDDGRVIRIAAGNLLDHMGVDSPHGRDDEFAAVVEDAWLSIHGWVLSASGYGYPRAGGCPPIRDRASYDISDALSVSSLSPSSSFRPRTCPPLREINARASLLYGIDMSDAASESSLRPASHRSWTPSQAGSHQPPSPERSTRGAVLMRVHCELCGKLNAVRSAGKFKSVKCARCGGMTPISCAPLALVEASAGGTGAGLRRALRICGPTSPCVRESFAAQGYMRDDGSGWTVAWGATLPFEEISRMGAEQRHNHMPGWNRLNHKGVLGEMAEALRSRGCGLSLNVPKTFVLPHTASLLAKEAEAGGGPYILKPVGGTRGKGIRLAKRLTADEISRIRGKWVCQRYIQSPHLIKGRKYDLRLYVTATSCDPLRLYVHSEAYARLCSEAYDPTLARPDELFRHVTNSGFQKHGGTYSLHAGSTPGSPKGNKWHIEAVRSEWRRQGVDDGVLWERIGDAITRVFLMFDSLGHDETRRFVRNRQNCFCLFGVDVLIDDRMQPWVLELNGVPSTGTDSPLDVRIKSSMMCDLLSLLGMSVRDPDEALREVQRALMASKGFDMARDGLALRESTPSSSSSSSGRFGEGGGTVVPTGRQVAETLAGRGFAASDAEVELVLEAERELARRRGWVRLFPSAGMGRYFPLLERHRCPRAAHALCHYVHSCRLRLACGFENAHNLCGFLVRRRSNELMMKWLTRGSLS